MTYEDTIRVAALKTRATRFERVRGEVRVGADQVLAINEYMHPRLQEICETLPAGLGRWLERPGWPRRLVERLTAKGRVVDDQLARAASCCSTRRGPAPLAPQQRCASRSRRERIEAWLARDRRASRRSNPALAVEVAQCQRLVKGYGDTHERGWRNFGRVMGVVGRAGAELAPPTLRRAARRRARRRARPRPRRGAAPARARLIEHASTDTRAR